jgi:tetratricopeptide (TPR) repeat protein
VSRYFRPSYSRALSTRVVTGALGRVVPLALAVSLGLASVGCGRPPRIPDLPDEDAATLAPEPVSDVRFATTVHRLLREGEQTPKRSALLAGAVQRQLAHAADLFERDQEVRGTNAVIGALYLMRVGEMRPDMFQTESLDALRGAMERFSARGDEGRALALMMMMQGLLPPGSTERQQLDRHVRALRRWMTETRTGGDMARLAADERSTIGRSLLEPRAKNVEAAAKAINAWVERAVEYNLIYQQTRQLPPRTEVAEAYKALQAGGETMAALFLRHGRARDALAMLEGTAAGKVTSPAFFSRLRAAAMDDTAEDWRLLARDFARLAFGEGELQMDTALVEAALWGIAVEAYRRDPTSLAIGHILADQLIELDMAEAAPLVLRDALGSNPSVVSLSAVTSTIAEALSLQYEANTLDVARRVFAASEPVLELADQDDYRGRLNPSAAQLRQLMAGIELRSGNVEAAQPLLVKALEAEPTVWGYTMLATLERQVGELDDALKHVDRAETLPNARRLPLDVVDAKLLRFEIHRDKGATDRAKAALDQALNLTLANRKSGGTKDKVRAERLLARVLDGYGERGDALRALERALDLAEQNREILGATVLSAVGRALVYKDLRAARAALQIGIKADVDRDDLVYGALWLMFLEQELGEETDGKVERVLLDAIYREGWTAQLARWARGMMDDAALRAAAQTHAERVEAEFYIAMKARIDGRNDADEELRKVANNPLIDLMEVQIARDLLAPESPAKLPPKVRVP